MMDRFHILLSKFNLRRYAKANIPILFNTARGQKQGEDGSGIDDGRGLPESFLSLFRLSPTSISHKNELGKPKSGRSYCPPRRSPPFLSCSVRTARDRRRWGIFLLNLNRFCH